MVVVTVDAMMGDLGVDVGIVSRVERLVFEWANLIE